MTAYAKLRPGRSLAGALVSTLRMQSQPYFVDNYTKGAASLTGSYLGVCVGNDVAD